MFLIKDGSVSQGGGGSGARTGCVGPRVRGVRTLPIHFLYDNRAAQCWGPGKLFLGLRVRELPDPTGEPPELRRKGFSLVQFQAAVRWNILGNIPQKAENKLERKRIFPPQPCLSYRLLTRITLGCEFLSWWVHRCGASWWPGPSSLKPSWGAGLRHRAFGTGLYQTAAALGESTVIFPM